MTFNQFYTFANSPAGIILIIGILAIIAALIFSTMAKGILGIAAVFIAFYGLGRLMYVLRDHM